MGKTLDLLAIILPLLLIVIGFMRVTGKKNTGTTARTRTLNSFTMLIAVLLLLLGGIRYLFPVGSGSSKSDEPKPEPISVSKHSDSFNAAFSNLLDAYYSMNEGFVNWDTNAIATHSVSVKQALDKINLDELKKDSSPIYLTALEPLENSKGNITTIMQEPDLQKKRETLNTLSENLRNLVLIVKYDKDIVYWQECPMAFNDEIPGYWLSKNEEIRNPYLGTKHPKYKATMLECGESKGPIVKDLPQEQSSAPASSNDNSTPHH